MAAQGTLVPYHTKMPSAYSRTLFMTAVAATDRPRLRRTRAHGCGGLPPTEKHIMAEVIPSDASFDPETVNLLSDAFEQAWHKVQTSGNRLARPAYARHGARSDGQTYLQFGRARRARREQTQQKRIPIFHRELQGLCRLSWRPHGPPGLSEDPAAHDCAVWWRDRGRRRDLGFARGAGMLGVVHSIVLI